MNKQEIRKMIKAFAPDSSGDAAVWSKVEELDAFKNADCVLVYASMPSELGTSDFISKWYGKKTILLPRVAGDLLDMCEYDPAKVAPGFRGIIEPTVEARVAERVDLAIVPGMAFDRECRRLGHGGGFYDRLLPGLDCPKIGVCREYQLVDEIPVEEWDQKVDIVVTPLNCYICKIC